MSKPIDVEKGVIEHEGGNLLGKTVNKIRGTREAAVLDAEQKMLTRHNVTPASRNKYKMVEDRTVMPNGDEVVEIRLYELVDGAVVTISTEVTSNLAGGINQLKEFNRDEPGKN